MRVIALLNDLTATIGENMRKYREKYEYTQKTVADLLNIDPQYYGEAERGRKRLSLERMVELCTVYKISLDDLIPVSTQAEEGDREGMLSQIQTVLSQCTLDQLSLIHILAKDIRDFAQKKNPPLQNGTRPLGGVRNGGGDDFFVGSRPEKIAALFFLGFFGFACFEGGFTPFTPTSLLKKACAKTSCFIHPA